MDNSTYIVYKYHYKDVPHTDPDYTTCVKEEKETHESLTKALESYDNALEDPLMEAVLTTYDDKESRERTLNRFERRRKAILLEELRTKKKKK